LAGRERGECQRQTRSQVAPPNHRGANAPSVSGNTITGGQIYLSAGANVANVSGNTVRDYLAGVAISASGVAGP